MVAVVVPAVLVDIVLVPVGVATLLVECDGFLFHSAMLIFVVLWEGQTTLVPARTSWNSTP